MRVKMILPALTEATSPFFRPIKYSLFPPLGLATLAAYLDPDDEIDLQDEHVERLRPRTTRRTWWSSRSTSRRPTAPIASPTTTARRGAHVALGGLHVTSLPEEAAAHADTIFLGPGRGHLAAVPRRLPRRPARARLPVAHAHAGGAAADPPRPDQAAPLPRAQLDRRLARLPARLRLLLQGGVLRGRQVVLHADRRRRARRDRPAARPPSLLPRRPPVRRPPLRRRALRRHARHGPSLAGGGHGERRAARRACSRRRWTPGCAASSSASRRSTPTTCVEQRKYQNLKRDYAAAVRRLHDLGVMINGSFVFGMDGDDPSVFERTVEWAIEQGIETATFHILTPYPGTALYKRIASRGPHHRRPTGTCYDTRHAVFRPARMSGDDARAGLLARVPPVLHVEEHRARRGGARQRCAPGYGTSPTRRAGRSSSRCGIWSSARGRPASMLPVLEAILSEFGRRSAARQTNAPGGAWPLVPAFSPARIAGPRIIPLTWDQRFTVRSMKSTSSRDTLVSGVPTDSSCDE